MQYLKIEQLAFERFEASRFDPRSKREQFLYPFYAERSIWYVGEWEVHDGYSGSAIKTSCAERAMYLVQQHNAQHIQDYIAIGTVYLSEEKGE